MATALIPVISGRPWNDSAAPPPAQVVREFLVHCQADAVREHLGNSRKKLARSPGGNGAQPANLPAVLRCTLGEQLYEELLGSIRETNERGNARAASM